MRIILALCCLLVLSSQIQATELPEFAVHSGENLIPITIRNATNRSIENLRIASQEDALPGWVLVPEKLIPLTGDGENHTISIPLTVINAPEGSFAQAQIPVILTDNWGRDWQIELSVRFNDMLPTETVLKQNIPNPFNPETIIEYHLAGTETHPTTLIIYNSIGQRVNVLVDAPQTSGVYKVRWDGTDDLGRAVASGVYLVKLISGSFNQTKTMVFLK